MPEERTFRPLAIGALYPTIDRGLTADILAARACGGVACTVCTAIISAGRDTVTDLLNIPADSVDAQIEHVIKTESPFGVRIGILGSAPTVGTVFGRLNKAEIGPIVWDVTLSGPSGEDIAGSKTREAIAVHLEQADCVTLRQVDAQLLAGMEISTLDDAQVAVQRLHRMGAKRVLLRTGRHLPPLAANGNHEGAPQMADLYYDGEEFALFEAPYMETAQLHGASSALTMALLRGLTAGADPLLAMQQAKSYVTEALRQPADVGGVQTLDYFWTFSRS